MADPTPADHPDGPWRSIPAPQSGLPWRTDGPAVQSREPASVAPEATGQPRPLNPAAQAVLDAMYEINLDIEEENAKLAAAALRAVADQVVPNPVTPHDSCCDVLQAHFHFELLAIAAELEGSDA